MGNVIYGFNALKLSIESCFRESIQQATDEAIERNRVIDKPAKKKKVVDQIKEGQFKKQDLARDFMARHRRKAEDKKTAGIDPSQYAAEMFENLGRSVAIGIPHMSPSERSLVIRHSREMDSIAIALGMAQSLPPTLLAVEPNLPRPEPLEGIQPHGHLPNLGIFDLQHVVRERSQRFVKTMTRSIPRQPVEPGKVYKLSDLTGSTKEKDHEQGTETSDRPD